MRQQAIRRIIRQLRTQLQSNGTYEDSKLALLDRYHVKLTELAADPLILRPSVKGRPHIVMPGVSLHGRHAIASRKARGLD